MEGDIITLHMNLEFLSAVILLLLVIDPFGNVPLANAMLADVTGRRRRLVILRECAIAFAVLVLFMVFGRALLALMHLSETSLSIAGGVILFMIAIRMVFAHPEGTFGAQLRGEPFIVPLAIPLIAGPSALATVMLMATDKPEKLGMWVAALTVTMLATSLILVTGDRLQRWLGERAMQAIERLMGLILTAIAVEMLLGGIRAFIEGLQ
jgi:MarC family membrane protein